MAEMTIVGIRSGLPEYNEGESVNLVITIRNDGLPAVSQIRIYNRVTGKLIQGFGSFLLTGEQFEYVRSIGAMPDENWKLTITSNGVRKEFTVQNVTQPEVVTEEVVEEEVIEEPVMEEPEIPIDEPIIPSLVPYIPTEVKVSGLPWFVSWLQPLADFFGSIAEGITNWFGLVFRPIYDFFGSPIKYIVDGLSGLFSKGSTESGTTASGLLSSILEGTPDWGEDLKLDLNALQEMFILPYLNALEPDRYVAYGMSPEDAVKNLENLGTDLVTANLQLFYTHALMEAGSLGQFEFIQSLNSLVVSKFGFDKVTSMLATIPYSKGLLPLVEMFYNDKFPLQLPTDQDLINMVVKEVIPLDTFTSVMRQKGFDGVWSKRIWDAHFFAPSLGNLLTSFRRGTIDEARLVELQILVDLDPRYNEIWHDSWYNDPTPRQARFMYETGAIDRARLKNIVERTGLLPDDVEPFTEYLATFNERQWKRRYVIELARGYRLDKISEDELRSEIMKVYFSEGVADWIVATEEIAKIIDVKEPKPPKVRLLSIGELKRLVKKGKLSLDDFKGKLSGRDYTEEDINLMVSLMELERTEEEIKYTTEELVEGLPKPKVLSLSELKKAYLIDKLDEDELRIRLTGMGYDLLDIDLLIEVLNEEKIEEVKPEKVVTLTVTQLLTAWRHNELTEDDLKGKLIAKNMDLLEIDILIATKKKQWGIE